MTITAAEFKAAAIETATKARASCGVNREANALADADFAIVASNRIAQFRAKAASVKSEDAKARWDAQADGWQEVLDIHAAEMAAGVPEELAEIRYNYVALFGGEIIGEAATKAEAIALTGFTTIHNIDFYDAEDGPRVQGYEADGKGVWIIDGE